MVNCEVKNNTDYIKPFLLTYHKYFSTGGEGSFRIKTSYWSIVIRKNARIKYRNKKVYIIKVDFSWGYGVTDALTVKSIIPV